MDTTNITTTTTSYVAKEVDATLYAVKEGVENSVVRVFDESLRFEVESHVSEFTIIAVLDVQ